MQSNETITWRDYAAALLGCLIFTYGFFIYKYQARLPYEDEYQYLGHAFSLFAYNTFAEVQDPSKMLEANMFFPPLYPFFLSMLMHLDQTFAIAVECVLERKFVNADLVCTPQYGIAIWVQTFMAAMTIFFVWATSWRLSRQKVVAWIAAVLAVVAKVSISYSNFFLTEAITLPLAAGFGWTLVRAWQDRTASASAWCAVFFAGLVLTRAGWDYALLVVIPIFVVSGILSWREKKWSAFAPLAVFCVVYAMVLSPWIARNYIKMDTFALTKSYDVLSLTHRLPYNHMRLDEWGVAFIYWLPEFGDSLAAKLFDKSRYDRLDFGSPNGFYTSERSFLSQRFAENGNGRDIFTYYIEDEVIGNLPKHTFVTLAMVWRGMFVAKTWGLIAWLFCLPLLIVALRRHWGSFIVLALPPIFMMGLGAFVSVSIPRYNIPLIPMLAFSVAYVCSNVYLKLRMAR